MKTTIGHYNNNNPLDDVRLSSSGIIQPFVTVIVTNYNYEKYILQCLKSIARQNYPHYKCIVVDDRSTDNSVSLITQFMYSEGAKGRFSFVKHEQNSGQMAAFKTGLTYAEGVFVVLVDADDILFEDFISEHVKAHMGRRGTAFTSSNQYQINENNEIIAGAHADLRVRGKRRHIKPRALHEPFWVWATTSSMMFRKSVLDLIMPDNCEDFRICADNYICHFANLIGGSLLMPEVYGGYRRHGLNCFSCNPIIGVQLPTGDMAKHPKHHIVRISIVSHILKNHERFSALLADNIFFITLLRLAGPYEIMGLKNKYPEYFKKKNFPLLNFVLISFAFKIKIRLKKYLDVFRYVFFENNRSHSDI